MSETEEEIIIEEDDDISNSDSSGPQRRGEFDEISDDEIGELDEEDEYVRPFIDDEEKRLARFRLSHHRLVQICNKHLGPTLALDDDYGYSTIISIKDITDTIIAADNASIIEIKDIKIRLTGDGFYIARLLTELSYITILDLNQASIHNKELIPIAAALRRNNTLTSLNLDNNHISYEGIVVLASALEFNTALKNLSLQNNIIRSKGAAALFAIKNNLHSLDLKKNQIGPLGYEGWTYNNFLIKLNLASNKINTTSGRLLAEFLKYNTSLQQLNLADCQLGYTGFQCLTEALKHNSTLRELLLTGNDLCSTSATQIADLLLVNNSIRVIDLSNNDVYTAGAIAIARSLNFNTGLIILNLACNNIRYNAARQIAHMLTNNNRLISLNLNNNPLSSSAVAAILLVLKHNKTLTDLNISKNNTQDFQGLYDELIKDNEKNMLKHRMPKYDISIYINLEKFNYFNYLEVLNFSKCHIGIGGALAIATMLKSNNTLTSLYLHDNYIKNEGLVALATALMVNTTLQLLNINNSCRMKLSGGASLAELLKINTSLTQLYIQESDLGYDSYQLILESLEFNWSLIDINLYDTLLYEDGPNLTESEKRRRQILKRNKNKDEAKIKTLQELTLLTIRKNRLAQYLQPYQNVYY